MWSVQKEGGKKMIKVKRYMKEYASDIIRRKIRNSDDVKMQCNDTIPALINKILLKYTLGFITERDVMAELVGIDNEY